MRADWFVSPFAARCGGCGKEIPKGEPRRRLRVHGVRCPACALQNLGEAVPGDLQPMPAIADAPEQANRELLDAIDRFTGRRRNG